ncbi:hypothetical protein K438DRAFT_1976180 [Mycena galopus ATCC 62051]|nr:hypothetical protein K438DRAFT_1976180 [Mycena galopus ATCC 62051]
MSLVSLSFCGARFFSQGHALLIDFIPASSNSPASSKPKSKRKSPDPISDAEDLPKAKRIRSTINGAVTLDEVPNKDDLGFRPQADDDPTKKTCLFWANSLRASAKKELQKMFKE